MTQQQVSVITKKPLLCKYCNVTQIEFDVNRKSKSGKLIPIEKSSGVNHNCKFSVYNLQKNGTAVKAPAETMLTISQIEFQELNTNLTKIERQTNDIIKTV